MIRRDAYVVVGAVLIALVGAARFASAQTAPTLGTAQGFAVLAGSAVTNTGATTTAGSVGVYPGSAITGFPPGIVTSGATHAANSVALQAQGGVTTAYNSLASQACTQDLTGQDLGGLTLTSGVYCFSSAAQLTGTLTMNAQGNPNAVFIFKMGSALTTASGSAVSLVNGASACNVFWQVGSSATIGTTSAFVGNVLALTSITMNTGASLAGRALARNGAVTMQSNTVNAPCLVPVTPSCPAITLAPPVLPAGRAGTAYAQQITAAGGTAPYTYTLTSGGLPAGVLLTPAGLLSGTPTTASSNTFVVRATDSLGCFASLPYTMTIAAAQVPPPGCVAINIVSILPPTVSTGTPFNVTLASAGGTAPYVYGVTAGMLPPGVTLTPTGTIAGTPSTPGAFAFTIRSTDANGCWGERSYAGAVVTPVPTAPQVFSLLLTAGLLGAGYVRLRRRDQSARS